MTSTRASTLLGLLSSSLVACGPHEAGPAERDSAELEQEGSSDAFLLGEPQPCTAPQAQVSRVDVTDSLDLDGIALPPSHRDGGGVSLAHLDEDGVIDLVYGFADEAPRAYLMGGEAPQLLPSFEFPTNGLSIAVDLDNDGLAEIVYAEDGAGVMWNEGGASFLPVLYKIPAIEDALARDVIPVDVDGDGMLDLVLPVTAMEEISEKDLGKLEDHVMYQRPERSWEAVGLGERGRRDAFDVVPLDHDNDGDLDLYVVNDKGTEYGGNVLWQNDDGLLVEAVESCECELVHSGMGGSAADFDNDGVVDLFLTASGANHLLQGLGDGTFVDVTRAAGVDTLSHPVAMGWGSAWLDHDNDGLLDLLVAQGDLWVDVEDTEHEFFESPVDLLIQQADGSFSEQGAEHGLPREGSWRGVAAWDLNLDGVLDLVLDDIDGPPRLMLSEGCTEAGWLAVDAPQGSRVVLEAGDKTLTRWPSHHPGFGATTPARAWFGLGAAQEVDRLEVVLPDGSVHLLSGPIEARRIIGLATD